jgi:hypothetical protein
LFHDDRIITSAGQATRVASAATAFVQILRQDPRVQRAFEVWCCDHAFSVEMELSAFRAALLRDKERDVNKLQRLVRDELGLAYAWLPSALLVDFGALAIAAMAGSPLQVDIAAPQVEELPAGRAPKGGDAYIRRDVGWYYRAEIRQPPESVYAIAKRHAAAQRAAGAPLNGISHSVVQNAIARTKTLLESLEPSDGYLGTPTALFRQAHKA